MNERDIANGFSAVWSEFFPMLSPTFIVAFNDAFVHPILGSAGIVQAVPSKAKTVRPDVLAEFGFRLASAAFEAGISVKAAARDKSVLDAADAAASKRIREFRPNLPRASTKQTGTARGCPSRRCLRGVLEALANRIGNVLPSNTGEWPLELMLG
jgi:hypothetical protein